MGTLWSLLAAWHRGLLVAGGVLVVATTLVWQAQSGAGGPDPAKWVLHQTGFWTLLLLVLTLCVSPLRRLVESASLLRWRRPVGLAAFALGLLHLLVYVFLYQALDAAAIAEDIGKRPYIVIGVLAWLILLALALTSTQSARRRMGLRWVRLHRLVYVALVLGLLHHGMAQKADLGEVLAFTVATFLLFAERLRARRKKQAPAP
jgi:sulfoxide reductase heme-binding subunit YedZ